MNRLTWCKKSLNIILTLLNFLDDIKNPSLDYGPQIIMIAAQCIAVIIKLLNGVNNNFCSYNIIVEIICVES